MASPRQIQTSLTKKFSNTVSTNFTLKGVSVGSKLKQDIQRQTKRLENNMRRKFESQRKVQQKSQQQLTLRSNLQNRIVKDIDEHTKHRQQFIQKRVKGEKYKIQEVQKAYALYQQAQLEKKKFCRNQFQKFKDHMQVFWTEKKQKQVAKMKSQVSVKPEHSDAVERKKRFERQNELFGLKTKSQLLKRHSPAKDRVISLVNRKKEEVHDVHTHQIYKNQSIHTDILSQRQNRYINSIGLHTNRSENLLRINKTQYEKKLERTIEFKNEGVDRIKTAFVQRKKERAQRLSSCKCWSKGKQQFGAKSVVVNAEQENGNADIKQKPTFKRGFRSSLEQSRNSFLQSSQITFNKVKNQQQRLLERQRAMSQRRLMRQNQISKGIHLRKQIFNDANCLIRKARFVKRQQQQLQAKNKV